MSKHALTIIDDLIAPQRLLEIRKEVISVGFATEKGPDNLDYTGISKAQYPELCNAIAHALGHNIAVTMSFFRFNTKGDIPHSWVHSDEGCASHAAILYLNTPDQCQGGTAFWRHRGMGLDEMPSDAELTSGQWKPDWFKPMMNAEWKKKKAWEMVGLAGMKFGRLITYRSTLFHSRWPFEAFGDSPETGRLAWVCFFDFTTAAPKADEPNPAPASV